MIIISASIPFGALISILVSNLPALSKESGTKHKSFAVAIINTSEEAGDYMMDIFLREAQSSYTDEMIYEFMQRAFQGEEEVLISDIPLPSFDAFVLLILGTLKKDDEKCFYEVIQEEGKLHSQGYVLPNIKFKRKEVLN